MATFPFSFVTKTLSSIFPLLIFSGLLFDFFSWTTELHFACFFLQSSFPYCLVFAKMNQSFKIKLKILQKLKSLTRNFRIMCKDCQRLLNKHYVDKSVSLKMFSATVRSAWQKWDWQNTTKTNSCCLTKATLTKRAQKVGMLTSHCRLEHWLVRLENLGARCCSTRNWLENFWLDICSARKVLEKFWLEIDFVRKY